MGYEIKFYTTAYGKQPVREFINSLDIKTRAKVMAFLERMKSEGNIPLPVTRKMEGARELHELRVKSHTGIYRFFYFVYLGNQIVLLHAFQKKSQQTPTKEIEVATERLALVLKA
ncbi:MAG: type II toxin-antitoxin system RelE/ParE family toxin [Candidatus Schekmanbacteria bacterium]|nr:type II toxin-antitoxin system RelE/ParE family toxin [Candidatus Schekmanbacteria bacterium]